MLPRTVAPGFDCQGPTYDIKGERAVMLTDLLAIMRRFRHPVRFPNWRWICRAARYQGNALWVSSRIFLLPVNNFVGSGVEAARAERLRVQAPKNLHVSSHPIPTTSQGTRPCLCQVAVPENSGCTQTGVTKRIWIPDSRYQILK
jgi:hypothetical protein